MPCKLKRKERGRRRGFLWVKERKNRERKKGGRTLMVDLSNFH